MKKNNFLCILFLLFVLLEIWSQVNKPALVIRANTESADISLNGIPLGKTSPNFAILLDPGTYSLKVSKPGYSEFLTTVTLPAESLIINVNLVPLAASLPNTAAPATAISPSNSQTSSLSPQSFEYSIVRASMGETMRSLVYGPNQFVAVGNAMIAMNSADGRKWSSPQKLPNAGNFTSVVYAKDHFFASGDYGLLYTSKDGQAWQRQSTGTTKHLGPVVWANGRYLMIGQSGTMLSSSDGAKWIALPISYSNNFLNITADKRAIVVTATQGLILYSKDGGVVWKNANSGVTDNLFGLASGAPGFVAGGSSQNAPLLFSPDGVTWSVVYRSNSSQTFGTIIWDGSRFLVAASYGELLESKNGQDWVKLPKIPNNNHAAGIAANQKTTVIVQSNGTIVAFPTGATVNNTTENISSTASGPQVSAVRSMKTVTLLKEDFEHDGIMGPLPSGWLRRDNNNLSYPYAWEGYQDNRIGNAHSGVWFARMVFGTSKAIITPLLELAEGGTATVTFWARNGDPKIETNLTVLLSHGGTDQRDFQWELGRIKGVADSYQKYTFEIGPEHSGKSLRVLFMGDKPSEGQIIFIDDIELTARIPEENSASSPAKVIMLLDENFENKAPPGVLPAGWLSRDNKNPSYPYSWDCTIDNRNAHSGIQSVMASGVDKGLITPPLAIPAGGSAVVSFWLRNRNPVYKGNLDVLLSYGGIEQKDFTDSIGKIRDAPDSYQLYSFEIGRLYAGRTIRLMFYLAESTQGQILQMDDIQVTAKISLP